MRRILLALMAAMVMALMMLAMAMPAFAARGEQGGAAANCGPPGQTHSDAAKVPGESTPETFEGPPDGSASRSCVRQVS